jgi:arginine decarboxylase-like protein
MNQRIKHPKHGYKIAFTSSELARDLANGWSLDKPVEVPKHKDVINNEIIEYYKTKIAKKKRVKLKMLHFFVDSGIKDNLYYWGEFRKALKLFAELKKICPTLDSINLGGGLPIRNNLGFEYDYKYMINELVRNIKEVCQEEGID